MKSLFTLVTALIFSVSALAVEQKLATITSDVEEDFGELFVENVDGYADSLRITRNLGQKIINDETFTIETLMGKKGAAVSERMTYDVVVIKFENFDPKKGGIVIVNHLYNALRLPFERREFRLKCEKEGSKFVLKSMEGAKVNHLHFLANKPRNNVVGVKSVEVSFK